MPTAYEDPRTQLLRHVAQLAGRQGGSDIETLLRLYYRHVVTEELLARRSEDLLGAVLSHRALGAQRMPGEAKLRVFTPTVEQEGWTAGHTVIEIVTDDMPFLVDSVSACAGRQGSSVHLMVHPQLVVRRDETGKLHEVLDCPIHEAPSDPDVHVESWMHLQIDRESDAADRDDLARELREVLGDVRASVEDWSLLTAKAFELADDLHAHRPAPVSQEDADNAEALLRWVGGGHFTLLGYREYALTSVDGVEALTPISGTGLGLMRAAGGDSSVAEPLSGLAAAKAREPEVMIVTKANSVSTVHRPVYLDYIGLKMFDESNQVCGERRFIGLFTAGTYTHSVTQIPYVSTKVALVIEASGFDPESHLGKDLMTVLETYPRDELFQASVADLTRVCVAVVHLQGRRQPRLFLRKDVYGRYMSCIVYIPRDRYTTSVRLKLEALLQRAFQGVSVEDTARVSESALARLFFVVRMTPGQEVPDVDVDDLQRQISDATRTWAEDLADATRAEYGEEHASRMLSRWGMAFPEAYKEDFEARVAVVDLRHVEALVDDGDVRLNLYHMPGERPTERRLKLYRRGAVSLTTIVPTFNDMGLEVTDERPYELSPETGEPVYVYDFGLRAPLETTWSRGQEGMRQRFQEAVQAVWSGMAESDGFNALVLSAGLTWRQVVMLRTVARYQRQVGTPFTQTYITMTLRENPHIACLLVELFETRFDPESFGGLADKARAAAEKDVEARIVVALDEVDTLDHDRIVRAFLWVIQGTLRTNFFQDSPPDEHGSTPEFTRTVCLKIDPHAVPGLPAPLPMFEIWVYSPRVEGVHLRFGKVARGGLRWSDRREDFRTEVLGLVKAQMVKNAVIVPTGSKGGFFAKRLPDPAVDRDAWLAEGRAAYRLFIASLLDVTDNRVGTEIVPPQKVVRHDADDPYLVVAADKGTATFSDLANSVAQSQGFWLDDAFASGGSAGYDHKGMGITARGAWESVKRHFRERGVDTQTQEFTAVGIGDMSGDVFGNGMLLSDCMRLVAAFDHRDIFLDPDPDAAASHAERRRLFELPRSSWQDYDKTLISEGGGVFSRSAKSISITPQVREILGLADDVEVLTPSDLQKAILLSPVDLLWNGGIGTYIKASTETNTDIGDRANDAIRVDGRDLRARVVGEGGNLGASQLGRVEAALAGVHINTDAIDNSAGVDTSDHEVNIKILLTSLTREGDMTLKQRNQLLASMTDDVSRMVLRDNYEQNVLLGNARSQSAQMLPVHQRLIHWLETYADLDRELEFLPNEQEIARRLAAGIGLMSPEFAVLVAYTKLALKRDLLASGLPDDAWFLKTLIDYFPPAIRESYTDPLDDHPLKREIIVNSIVNSMINRGGITFSYRAMDETGAPAQQVAACYVVAREVFGMRPFVEAMEALDNQVPTLVQTRGYLEFRGLLDRAVRWLLLNRPGELDIAAEVERFSGPAARLTPLIPQLVLGRSAERLREVAQEYVDGGVPEDLAVRCASLLYMHAVLDIVALAGECEEDVEAIAQLYYAVSEAFAVEEMQGKVRSLNRDDRWNALARAAMRDDLFAVLESLVATVASATDSSLPATARLEQWLRDNATSLTRARAALEVIQSLDEPGLAPLSVALRTLRGVARAGKSSG